MRLLPRKVLRSRFAAFRASPVYLTMHDQQLIVTLSVVAKEDLYLDESKEILRFPKGNFLVSFQLEGLHVN